MDYILSQQIKSDINLYDCLIEKHIRFGNENNTALLYLNENITFGFLKEKSELVSAYISEYTKFQDCVVIVTPDTPAFVCCFLACLKIGVIAVPVSPFISSSELEYILEITNAKLCIVDEIFYPIVNLQKVKIPVCKTGDFITRKNELEDIIHNNKSKVYPTNNKENSIAYCLFSSATTGLPKGIPHKHSDIIYCIDAFSIYIQKMNMDDIVLSVPKFSFGFGLGGNLISSLLLGAKAILIPDKITPKIIIDAALQYKPTIFLCQPRMLSDILNTEANFNVFKSLRLTVSAGERLSNSILTSWNNKVGSGLIDGFGTTEVGHIFISTIPENHKLNSVGKVLFPYRIEIRDMDGNNLEIGQIGELWVTGPSLALRYYNDVDRTNHSFKKGWVRTGDMASIDSEGFVYLHGRSDSMIKAGCGQWISPFEIEEILNGLSYVLECAVVGFSDEQGLVQPKAYIVLKEGFIQNKQIVEDIIKLIKDNFPNHDYKHIHHIEFISSLPRNNNGKLMRQNLNPRTLNDFSFDC